MGCWHKASLLSDNYLPNSYHSSPKCGNSIILGMEHHSELDLQEIKGNL
jgi:hypothetical protein